MSEMEWGADLEGWQMSISLDQERFLIDNPVLVTIATKNISGGALKISVSSKWTTYEYVIRHEGKDIPLTRFGRRMEESRGEGSYSEPELPDGDTIVLELPISRLFDLSLFGTYTLTVKRSVFRRESGEQVTLTSNEVSFEIVGK